MLFYEIVAFFARLYSKKEGSKKKTKENCVIFYSTANCIFDVNHDKWHYDLCRQHLIDMTIKWMNDINWNGDMVWREAIRHYRNSLYAFRVHL